MEFCEVVAVSPVLYNSDNWVCIKPIYNKLDIINTEFNTRKMTDT